MRAALLLSLLLPAALRAQTASVPRNNATQCAREARIALMTLKPRVWGAFEFNCGKDGRIEEFFAQENSPVAKDFPAFAREHSDIFDGGPVELVDDGEPELELVRRRLGLPYHSGAIESGPVSFEDGRRRRAFAPKPYREPAPGFSAKPAVSSSAAAAAAQTEARAHRVQPSRAFDTELVIEAGRCRDNGRLTLAWRVSMKEARNAAPLVCFIDAATGRPCGCRSSTDPTR